MSWSRLSSCSPLLKILPSTFWSEWLHESATNACRFTKCDVSKRRPVWRLIRSRRAEGRVRLVVVEFVWFVFFVDRNSGDQKIDPQITRITRNIKFLQYAMETFE